MMQSNKYGSQKDYMTDDQVLAACKKYLGEPIVKEEPKTTVSHKMAFQWKSFFRKQTNSVKSVFGGYKLRLLKAQDKSKKCLIGIGGGGSNILSDIHSINNIHKFIHEVYDRCPNYIFIK